MTVHFDSSETDEIMEAPALLASSRDASGLYGQYGKRALDLSLILICSPIIFLVLGFITLVLRASGTRPFYVQERLGKDGRVFRMIKFRTMVENAEEVLESHLDDDASARLEWDRDQKLKKDPRITTLGRFLRKTSLDELPQLLNVVAGDMSLVGPRPMMTDQADMYPSKVYYKMLPGITGLWQVSDRNSCEFKARAGFDAQYLREMSLPTDASILFRTVFTVLRGTGY